MNNFKKTLLIDADDTLWDNNIYFEKAISEFVKMMKDLNLIPDQIEDILREREMANVKLHGYGSINFGISMIEVYDKACGIENKSHDPEVLDHIEEIKLMTRDYPIKLLKGVEETLPIIGSKNNLILVTKGNTEEQLAKVARSGLKDSFQQLKVVPEKNKEIYRNIVAEFKLNPEHTWMVGNSPRSDINPAKAIGLGTVFVPYHNTWEHELETIIREGRETIHVKDFSELAEHFG